AVVRPLPSIPVADVRFYCLRELLRCLARRRRQYLDVARPERDPLRRGFSPQRLDLPHELRQERALRRSHRFKPRKCELPLHASTSTPQRSISRSEPPPTASRMSPSTTCGATPYRTQSSQKRSTEIVRSPRS